MANLKLTLRLILPPGLSISVPIYRYFKERSQKKDLRSHLGIELETSGTEGRALTNFSPLFFRLSHLLLYKNLVTVDNPIIRWEQPKTRLKRSRERGSSVHMRKKLISLPELRAPLAHALIVSSELTRLGEPIETKVFVWRIKLAWLGR